MFKFNKSVLSLNILKNVKYSMKKIKPSKKGLNIQKKVLIFQERFKHSPKSLNIPKKSKQNTLLWVAAPREGNPPGKHILKCIFTKK